MKKETKKAPTIRFRGFTDDWEQRKLEDFGEIITGSTPSTNNPEYYSEDGIPWVTPTDILENTISNTSRKLSKEGEKVSRVVPANSILVTCIASIGKNTMLTTKGSFNQQINGIIPDKQNYNPYFLLTESNIWSKEMIAKAAAGTMQIVNKHEFSSIKTMVPSLPEQQYIGALFEKLDYTVTLHQRKLDQLKTLKKYFLQNMFPAKGEKVPRIRFKGFTGDWEQRKVGEFYDFKNGLNKNKEFFGTGVPIVNFTDVFHNRGLTASQLEGRVTLEPNEIKNYRVKKGDIFFTRTSETIEEIGYPSVMLDTPENTVFSGFVLRGRCFSGNDPLDNLFKQYVFFTQSFRGEMKKKSSMTTRALTSGTSIKEMLFQFPSSKNEQHQIGKCITKFDDLITLHQRKLDQLQTMKKFMLQNMFI